MSVGASARLAFDHLVVAARSIGEGVAWCEAELGVVPAAGGKHPLMGTHNRLVNVGSVRYPRSFLEIVAVDPDAPAPGRPRWFDLDGEATRAALASGPKLVQWVARTDAIDASLVALRAAGLALADPNAAERLTARGLLRWRIALMADGSRPAGGALPLLIEWGGEHPCDSLPTSAVVLEQVELAGVSASLATMLGVDAAPTMSSIDGSGISEAEAEAEAEDAPSLRGTAGTTTAAGIIVVLRTPIGLRRLSSPPSTG
ncbi:MAG TPA: VOC family protein [Caldimonas sp.]|nr:VOC family protein [Caldimonas sp.]